MSFILHGTIDNNFGPILKKVILANSLATSRGDAVRVDAGVLKAPTATVVLGHIVQHVTADGTPLINDGAGSIEYNGTYTTASDNETVAKVAAQIDMSKMTTYTGDVDADIPADSLLFTRLNLKDKDELTATGAPVSGGTYALHSKVATRKAVVSIAVSQLFN